MALEAARGLLRADDPRLAPRPDLAFARAVLAAYRPPTAAQSAERDRILAFVDAHPDALHRSCLEGHLTASALVLDASGERVLLTLHRKLGRWLQLGGHCDGDGNLPGVALREAIEESGIPDLAVDPRPVDVDVHVIPARPGEPEHLHLDTRFLIRAPRDARAVPSEESIELAWLSRDELQRRGPDASDASVLRLFDLVWDTESHPLGG